jgi:GNAT superfamily N-acetyltransferase
LLVALERYYDEVPRAFATPEDIGELTLFLRRDPDGWPYYARPRLGGDGAFTLDDVRRVRARQEEAAAPVAFEWVEETSPGLGPVLEEAGLEVERLPLMVLAEPLAVQPPAGVSLAVLSEHDPDEVLRATTAAVDAGFGEREEEGRARPVEQVRRGLAGGHVRMVGAFRDDADSPTAVGGGSHSPRGDVTELMGIAVLPHARGQGIGTAITAALVADARDLGVETVFLSASSQRVADVYARVGFERVGTACIAEGSP